MNPVDTPYYEEEQQKLHIKVKQTKLHIRTILHQMFTCIIIPL